MHPELIESSPILKKLRTRATGKIDDGHVCLQNIEG